MADFLPITLKEAAARGWKNFDVIIVTGDAYVDHPAYGAAVIGRVLQSSGFRVGIIPQPDWKSTADFMRLGRPRLFFGITSGNLDSMVANYTSNKRKRRLDGYSPGGLPGLRPDRAVIVYANRVREAFHDVPIVLGGIEASLRRLAHYDWWDNGVRRSILLDARADILVYGMGEEQVTEIARRIDRGEDLYGIRGTVVVRKDAPDPLSVVELPSYEAVSTDKRKFNEAFRLLGANQDPFRGKTLVQPHGPRMVVQFPPPLPLQPEQLDAIYALPFERTAHPAYEGRGIPGLETVKFSIISHRGCCGACSFCSLSMHQGSIIQSRSPASVVAEAKRITQLRDFKGTITDVGGPTVNLYGAHCALWSHKGHCEKRDCLIPSRCGMLTLAYGKGMEIYRAILALPGVKHMFIESGIRYDLLVDDDARPYLEYLCRHHIGGRMKVAPEHCVNKVLRVMNKPGFEVYERFVVRFRDIQKQIGKDQHLVNYFISSHPGATLEDEKALSDYLKRRRMHPEQIQDYTPLPLTAAACMYYTGEHPFTGENLYTAKSPEERKTHRALIQYMNPDNRHLISKANRTLADRPGKRRTGKKIS